MTPADKISELEIEIKRLKDKEKQLEHDMQIYRQVFDHMVKQMEEFKKQLK